MQLSQLITLAQQIGFTSHAPVNMSALKPSDEVRDMCASGRCGMYNKSWGCPPACGTIASLSSSLLHYHQGLLLQTTEQLEDDFDLDTIRSAEAIHKLRFDTIARQARALDSGCLPMSAGACTRCKKCTYPNRPCRYPNKLFPSMEAYGLLVGQVCRDSGLAYNHGPRTITYTSCILF